MSVSRTSLAIAVLMGVGATRLDASPIPLPSHRQIDIEVSNDAGARLGSGPNDTYYIDAPGGGLNQLHITNDVALPFGQVTHTTTSASSGSGSFWVTTTGGRGYNDELILLLSVTGTVADDFSIMLTSSGYQWTPVPGSQTVGSDRHYVADAVSETFGQDDFLYGPQVNKPGPGSAPTLPFYSGQNLADPSTASYLMFVDLYVGNTTANPNDVNNGHARVDFTYSGLYDSTLAFNVYAYALVANVANGSINWTNNVSSNLAASGQSGYAITSTAAIPTPEPGTMLLCGSAVIAGLIRRKTRP